MTQLRKLERIAIQLSKFNNDELNYILDRVEDYTGFVLHQIKEKKEVAK